jgi:hypothetical protein
MHLNTHDNNVVASDLALQPGKSFRGVAAGMAQRMIFRPWEGKFERV